MVSEEHDMGVETAAGLKISRLIDDGLGLVGMEEQDEIPRTDVRLQPFEFRALISFLLNFCQER